MFHKIFVLIIFSMLFYNCDDGCFPEEMKCQDNKVMICNADEDWDTWQDCDKVEVLDPETESEWVCMMDVFEDGEACCMLVQE